MRLQHTVSTAISRNTFVKSFSQTQYLLYQNQTVIGIRTQYLY